MGRWSHLDTDDERLPDGMTRVGYDADTQTYTFRDTNGSLWRSAPGCQYGKLFRVKDATPLGSVTVEREVDGDEPEQVLNEGEWEPPGDGASIQGDSFVKKIIRRLNSVKRSRADTATSAHDSVAQQSDDGSRGDGKQKVGVETRSISPSPSPTADEKQRHTESEEASDGTSPAKGKTDQSVL